VELSDFPEAQAWLAQFHALDQPLARELLRSLALVSASQFRRGLRELLDTAVPHDTIALYAITESTSATNGAAQGQ
jgi:hypothetical protein